MTEIKNTRLRVGQKIRRRHRLPIVMLTAQAKGMDPGDAARISGGPSGVKHPTCCHANFGPASFCVGSCSTEVLFMPPRPVRGVR
jgi:hypothetical protein